MNLPERLRLAATLIMASIVGTIAGGAAAENLSAQSRPAGLHVSMHSELEPLAINQMHSWVITLQDSEGEPIDNTLIHVEGGMPLHNHGLATRPQVTESLGQGRYLLQGMRFHMNGDWELRLQIEHDGVTYQTTFNLTL